MTKDASESTRIGALKGQVNQLQVSLRELEEERDRQIRRRRRDQLIVGIGLSLLAHISLMYFLAVNYRAQGGGDGPNPVSYEFAILQEEELTELEATELDDLLPEVASPIDDLLEEEAAAELDPAVAAAELEVAAAGSMPTLGGSGAGDGTGSLTGGGAGTTFFGVSSRGTRFAYIVDRSGSMGQGRKMSIAMQELARSISGLPDYASFHVVLFSTGFVEPPMQKGWMRARKTTITRFIRWLNDIDPTGGTLPLPAFQRVYGLSARPDVIFFLTDGEIPADTAEALADLNSRGSKVIINTIAFGDDKSQALLRRIASDSGGVYRFVAAGGG